MTMKQKMKCVNKPQNIEEPSEWHNLLVDLEAIGQSEDQKAVHEWFPPVARHWILQDIFQPHDYCTSALTCARNYLQIAELKLWQQMQFLSPRCIEQHNFCIREQGLRDQRVGKWKREARLHPVVWKYNMNSKYEEKIWCRIIPPIKVINLNLLFDLCTTIPKTEKNDQ